MTWNAENARCPVCHARIFEGDVVIPRYRFDGSNFRRIGFAHDRHYRATENPTQPNEREPS